MTKNHMNETETQTRLRRANETLAACRAAENELRKALAEAVESTRRAKEKAEELYHQNEREQVKLRLQNYRHCTA